MMASNYPVDVTQTGPLTRYVAGGIVRWGIRRGVRRGARRVQYLGEYVGEYVAY